MNELKYTIFVLISVVALSTTAGEKCPSIGTLETNEFRVLLHCDNGKSLYTVRLLSGAIVSKNLSKTEFATKFPQLNELIDSGVAIDAGLNHEYQKPSNHGIEAEF